MLKIMLAQSIKVYWFRELEQSEDFSLLIYLDAVKFVLISFFTLVKKIQLKSLAKPLPRNVKSPLPVPVCRSKTPLLSSLMIGLCSRALS